MAIGNAHLALYECHDPMFSCHQALSFVAKAHHSSPNSVFRCSFFVCSQSASHSDNSHYPAILVRNKSIARRSRRDYNGPSPRGVKAERKLSCHTICFITNSQFLFLEEQTKTEWHAHRWNAESCQFLFVYGIFSTDGTQPVTSFWRATRHNSRE